MSAGQTAMVVVETDNTAVIRVAFTRVRVTDARRPNDQTSPGATM
jgi:hypothetical protein